MANAGKEMSIFCSNVLKKIEKITGRKTECEKIKIKIVPKLEAGVVAQAEPWSCTIRITTKIVKNGVDQHHVLAHELTHLNTLINPVDEYLGGDWLVEGLADYVSEVRLDLIGSYGPVNCVDDKYSRHYRQGYSCSAALIKYIEEYKKKDIVKRLTADLKDWFIRPGYQNGYYSFNTTQYEEFFKNYYSIGPASKNYKECRAGSDQEPPYVGLKFPCFGGLKKLP